MFSSAARHPNLHNALQMPTCAVGDSYREKAGKLAGHSVFRLQYTTSPGPWGRVKGSKVRLQGATV